MLMLTISSCMVPAGKLSVNTPIAKALIGKKLGDLVEVQVPAGTMQLEIVNISI